MREVLVKVYKFSELSSHAKHYVNIVLHGIDRTINQSNDPEYKEAQKIFDRTKAEYFADGILYTGDK